VLGNLLGVTLVLLSLSSVIVTETFAESFTADFDKQSYHFGDSLIFSGEIFDFGMPIIAMSVYNPDNKILSANSLEITSQNTFSKSIPLDSIQYEKTGQYLVKLDYGTVTQNYHFVIEDDSFVSETIIEIEEPEIILLYTEKKQYTDKDILKITGLVSLLDSPTVLVGIYDPFGMPTGFYFASINSDLEFSTSFLVKSGVNFRIDGVYSVKAHYAESEAISFFDFNKISQPIISDDVTHGTFEETKKSFDEIINETIDDTVISSDKKITETFEIVESTLIDDSLIDDSTQKTSTNENIILQNNNKDTSIKKINSETKKIIHEKNNSKKITSEIETVQTNLTVGDIELGKLLNQINLKCNSSTFTDTISYYDGMGPALYRLCKFDSSLNFFNESLIDSPDDIEILVNKGSTLGKLGHFHEAIVYYDQAIQIDSSFLPAKNNKANALAYLGNLDEAISLYREIIEKNPDYTTAQNNLKTALFMIPQTSDIKNTSSNNDEIPVFKKLFSIEKTSSPKLTSTNFFEEVSIAFSNLDSLFNFFN
jgi:tetratricopeptide (TPR) repeat protein